MKIGIFGGTFNPVHYGHLRAAEEVREKLGLGKILFIPSGKPPLKTSEIAPAGHRYEMLRIAVKENPSFELSDIECKRTGKSYTVKTFEELQNTNPGTEFFLILGIDAFLDIPRWWRPEQLVSMANFIVISRPGFSFSALRKSPYVASGMKLLRDIDRSRNEANIIKLKTNRNSILFRLTPIGISSTQIRKCIRQGKSIKYLLPPEVHSYIITHKLYKVKSDK